MIHKHKGVLTSSGGLRAHPLERKHKDKKVQTEHNKVIGIKIIPFKQPVKKMKKKTVLCSVDSDGYINIDLDKCIERGIRIKFMRREGRTKRTVGLCINREKY